MPQWILKPERYELGSLCKYGHDHEGTGKSLRAKDNGTCIACKRQSYHRNKPPLLPSRTRYTIEDRGYETPCWIWAMAKDAKGYGMAFDDRLRKNRRVHITMYEKEHGSVPDGMELDHLCKQRSCCNPSHLEPVSHAENVRRGGKAKLNWNKVRELRELAAHLSTRELSERFGVSPSNVRAIVRGSTWSTSG